MELLSATHVALEVAGEELFTDVSLRLSSNDRVGLVGANGSGKSTLLRLLAGAAPGRGAVRRGPGVGIGLLGQSDDGLPGPLVRDALAAATRGARELEARMRVQEARLALGEADDAQYEALRHEFERRGGYAAEARAREVLAALGFGQGRLGAEVESLSAGQRRRLHLATVLAGSADVLLLDEPTNHLDLAAREWLAEHLAAHDGAVVVVSHDRALLDAATNRTAFLAAGRLWHEPGSYGVARRRRDLGLLADAKRRRDHEREAQRLERMAAELAAFGTKAAARKRRAEKRSLALRALGASAARPVASTLVAGAASRSGGRGRSSTLVTARHLSAGVVEDASFSLARGQRVALLGPNGSGKSTLVRLLAGDLTGAGPLAELDYLPGLKLRLVDQDARGLEPGVPLLRQVEAVVGAGAARLLASAGVPRRAWDLAPEQASGGERARAGLALAFAQRADLWILDEPSNDLDLEGVEALEAQLLAALEAGGGALLLATHDRRLAEHLTSEVWSVVDGRLMRFGGVREYLAGEALGPVELEEPNAAVAPAPAPTEPAPAAEAPEADLHRLEDERTALLALLTGAAETSERDRQRLNARVGELEAELMQRYDARLPPPAPRYRVVEGGLTVLGDTSGGRLALELEGHAARLEAVAAGGVAHLRLLEPTGACLLPWARGALVDAGVRLAFTVLGVSAVQLQTERPFPSRWLERAADDWHTAQLAKFLRAEGWRPSVRRRRKRKAGRGAR